MTTLAKEVAGHQMDSDIQIDGLRRCLGKCGALYIWAFCDGARILKIPSQSLQREYLGLWVALEHVAWAEAAVGVAEIVVVFDYGCAAILSTHGYGLHNLLFPCDSIHLVPLQNLDACATISGWLIASAV